MKCKVCSSGEMVRKEGKNYSVCNVCNAAEIHYVPQPHQAEFHSDNHIFKAIFGAYGSGKTTTATIELIRHALSVRDGLSAMLAPTMQMLKETSYAELMKYLPHTFVEHEIKTKGSEAIILKNGHKILLLPSNSADKIRSLNLSAFYLEEASNAAFDVYTELTARTRNKKAIEYEYDEEGKPVMEWDDESQIYRHKVKKNRLLGLICSNPDVGWIRTKILHFSDKVYAKEVYPVDPNANPFLSTHLHSSYQNKYLDRDFQVRIGRGKPDWWVKRYIYGSFDYAEGLVYPMFSENVVDPFIVPPTWKRMFGVDFGLRDPTVMLAAAIDPEDGIMYIYDEHYQTEKPVSHHAKAMKAMLDKVPHGMINGQVIADPAGQNRGKDFRSYFTHYSEYGLWFKPAANQIDSGIMKVFTYFSLGKLKIMSNCVNLIREGREYKYKESTLDQDKNRGEKPIDSNNHAMDALRYILSELPDDPSQMVAEVYNQINDSHYNPELSFPKALQDDNYGFNDDWYKQF